MPPKKKRGLPPGALHHVERKHFKVLFCGKEFPAGSEETRKALEKHDAVGFREFVDPSGVYGGSGAFAARSTLQIDHEGAVFGADGQLR